MYKAMTLKWNWHKHHCFKTVTMTIFVIYGHVTKQQGGAQALQFYTTE